MKDVIVMEKFKDTGPCEINVEMTVKTWDANNDSISQWHEEYRLVGTEIKITISKEQAHQLIGRLNLIDEPSTIFNHARTWRLNPHNHDTTGSKG